MLYFVKLQVQREWHREAEHRGAEDHDGEAGCAADSPRTQGDDQGACNDFPSPLRRTPLLNRAEWLSNSSIIEGVDCSLLNVFIRQYYVAAIEYFPFIVLT